MSSWPKSEQSLVILNGHWFVEGKEFAFPSTEPAAVAQALLAFWQEHGETPPRALRILYEPEWLTHAVVTCPRGQRSLIREVLQPEHPALADPDRAWSFMAIVEVPEGQTAVLSHETTPWLHAFCAALPCAIVGAWPLHAVLQQLVPDCDAVIASPGKFSLHSALGLTGPERYTGPQAWEQLRLRLQGANSPARTLLWIALGESGEPPPELDRPVQPVTGVELARVLRELSPDHSANFLAPEFSGKLARTLTLSSSAALVAAIALGVFAGWEWQQRKLQAESLAEKTRQLQVEVATLDANKVEMEALQHYTLAAKPTGSFAGVLRRVSQTMPPQVRLTEIHVEADRFIVSGKVDGGAGTPEQQAALARLVAGTDWSATAGGDSATFTLTGKRKSP